MNGEPIRVVRVWLIAAGLFAIPLVMDPRTYHPVLDIRWSGLMVLSGLLALAHALGALLGERHRSVHPALLAGVAGLALLHLLHVVFAPDRAYTRDAVEPFLACLFLVWSVSQTVRTPTDVRLWAGAVAASTLLLCAHGVMQHFGHEPLSRLGLEWKDPLGLATASAVKTTLGNPHYVGIHLIAALFFVAAWKSPGVSAKGLFALFAIAVLIVAGLSRSRSAFLGLAGGLLYLGMARAGWRLPSLRDLFRFKWVAAAGLVVLLAAGTLAAPRFASLVKLRDQSFNTRLLLWQVAGEMWRDHRWLGVGAGRFQTRFVKDFVVFMQDPRSAGYRSIADELESLSSAYVHNEFLQQLTEFGIAGFGVWALFYAALLTAGAGAGARRADLSRHALGTLAAATMAMGLFSFPLHLPATALLFYTGAGILLSRDDEDGGDPARKRRRALAIAAAMALALIGAAALSSVMRNYPAYIQAGSAVRELMSRQTSNVFALRQAEEALKARPFDGEIRLCRGVALASQGQYNRAIQEFDEAEPNFSGHTLYYYRGLAYYFARQFQRAEQDFRKVLALDPDFREIRYRLGQIAYERRDYREAAALFEAELRSDPHFGDCLALFADCLYELGDFAEAEKAFRRLLDLAPGEYAIHARLARIQRDLHGNLHEAAIHYERAAALARTRGLAGRAAEFEQALAEVQRLREIRSGTEPAGDAPEGSAPRGDDASIPSSDASPRGEDVR